MIARNEPKDEYLWLIELIIRLTENESEKVLGTTRRGFFSFVAQQERIDLQKPPVKVRKAHAKGFSQTILPGSSLS